MRNAFFFFVEASNRTNALGSQQVIFRRDDFTPTSRRTEVTKMKEEPPKWRNRNILPSTALAILTY